MSTTILLSMRVFLVEGLNCVAHCAYCFDNPPNCPWGFQDVGFGFADDFMVTLIIVLQNLNECVLQIQTKQISPFYRTGHTKCHYGMSLFFPSRLETSHKTNTWNDYLSGLPLPKREAIQKTLNCWSRCFSSDSRARGLLWLEVWRRESLDYGCQSHRGRTSWSKIINFLSYTLIATFTKLSFLFWGTYTLYRFITPRLSQCLVHAGCLVNINLLMK